MILAFELSGEHTSLPASEALACLEIQGAKPRLILAVKGLLVVEVEKVEVEELAERLALTHRVLEVIATSKASTESILEMAEALDFRKWVKEGERYAIRVKTTTGSRHSSMLEARIGSVLYRQGLRASLKRPDISFRLLLTPQLAFFCRLAAETRRKEFKNRKPQSKPFFYPGVILPTIARALVNLTLTRKGESLLDPFCGTASIPVEAGILGIHPIASDIQEKMVIGARANLQYYLDSYTLLFQDASRLALKNNTIDGIATDVPYGRSAAVRADSLEVLIKKSLTEFYRVLRPGRRLVITSNRPLAKTARFQGFKILEIHLQRVHRSLTRRIYVMEKPAPPGHTGV